MMFKNKLMKFASLAALCAAPAMADFYYQNMPYFIWTPIDFSAQSTISGHNTWGTWTPPGGSAGTKKFLLALNSNGSGGACYSLSFEAGPGTSNPDLRLWTNDNRSIDDDGPSGSYLPRALLWITGPYQVTVSAYSTSSNNVDFAIYNYLYTGVTSAASCNDGVTPFFNMADNSIARANSTVN
jgi:hypothetical protein